MAEERDRIPPDLTVKSSTYGQVMPIPYGPVRVIGNIIWALDRKEIAQDPASVADANGTLTTTEYLYFATFAAAFSDCEVEAIEKIWLDGKLVYDGILAQVDDLLTNGDLETWTDSTTPGTWTTSGTIARNDTVLDPDIEDSTYSAKLSTGSAATQAYISQDVTFASTNQHNFRFRVYGGDSNPQWVRCVVSFAGTNYEPWFRVPTGRWTTIQGSYTPASTGTEAFKILIRDVPNADVYIDSVTLTETTASTIEGVDDATTTFAMEVFTGTEEQSVSSIIDNNHPWGTGYTPAYRGQAYAVFKDLPLLSFNNRIPKVEAQIQSYEKGVKDMVEDACSRCGLDADEYDVSDMDDTFTGMVILQERTGSETLSVLRDASPFAIRETGDRIEIVKLSGLSSSRSFDEDDLNARVDNDAPDTALRISIEDEALLPAEVTVTTKDPDHDQDDSTQRSRSWQLTVGNSKNYNWPIVATTDKTRQFADVILARSWIEARSFEWTMGSDNIDLQPGDIITITRGDEDIQIRITDIELTGLGLLQCSGVEYYADGYASDSLGAGTDASAAAPATA